MEKVKMGFIAVFTMMSAWLVLYAAETVGIKLSFAFLFGALAAVWLICNELLSILENIADIGVELPPFLMKAVKHIK